MIVAKPAKQCVFLRDEVNQSAVENENVELPVIVEVVDAAFPNYILRVGLRDAVGRAEILEATCNWLCSRRPFTEFRKKRL